MAAASCQNFFCCFVLFSYLILGAISHSKVSEEDLRHYRQRVLHMFHHAYDGYLKYAYPYDELRPLTCDGTDTWGSYSLTLVDALDTLAIMGNYTEFQRVAQLLADTLDFDKDINVSVFETNIRVVGGLLSAHLLSRRAGMTLDEGWPCSGPLLQLAENAARRLLPAFNTSTGMPYGTVNLKHGVPRGETSVTCTAGVGTFIVEFGTLSRLTGDPVFEEVAMTALRALWDTRSEVGLMGNHIDVTTGKWTALDSGIGAGVDSYFEYLVKGSILFQHPEMMEMFHEYVDSIEQYLKREDWYMWAHMRKGTITLPVFQSLEAFWPGIQSLVGDIDKGMKTLHNYHQVWKQYGFTPEFYNIPKAEVQNNREGYPLRPELIESTMYLYRATGDPYLLDVAIDILESIEHNCRTRCGYSTVKDVRDHRLENRMESFFLAETTKYLYLMFDPDNFIHNTGDHATVINTPNGECVIDAGGYVFNTEAHPVDAAALYCCSAEKKEHDRLLQEFHDNVDLLALLDIVDSSHDPFANKENQKKKKKKRPVKTKLHQTSTRVTLPSTQPEGPQRTSANLEIPIVIKSTGANQVKIEVTTPKEPNQENALKLNLIETIQSIDKSSKSDIEQTVDKLLASINELSGTVKIGNPKEEHSSTENVADSETETDAQSEANSKSTDMFKLVSLHTTDSAASVKGIQVSEEADSTEGEESTKSDDKVGADETQESNSPAGAQSTREDGSEEDEGVCSSEEQKEIEEVEEEEEEVTRQRLFTCPAQPFHSRLSVMGEMFLVD